MDDTACYQDKYRSGKLTASAGLRSGGLGCRLRPPVPLRGTARLCVSLLVVRRRAPHVSTTRRAYGLRPSLSSSGHTLRSGRSCPHPNPGKSPRYPVRAAIECKAVRGHLTALSPHCPLLPRLPNDAPPLAACGCAKYTARGGAYQNPVFLDTGDPYPVTAPLPRPLDCAKYSYLRGERRLPKTRLLTHWAPGYRGRGGARSDAPCTPRTSHAVPPLPPLTYGGGISPSHPRKFCSTFSLRCKPCLRHRYAATGLTAWA